MQRAREKLGIKNLRLHDLRHEATSRLFEKFIADGIRDNNWSQNPNNLEALYASKCHRNSTKIGLALFTSIPNDTAASRPMLPFITGSRLKNRIIAVKSF
jgi:hypothetical protein